MNLVLSLFPGIGLLDMAFEEEGFCVVRGPDLLWGGDVRRFHPPAGKFDGVIGGPPCQLFSPLKRLVPNAGERHGNQIPEFERIVHEAQPTWFVMENARPSPLPVVPGYLVHSQLLNNRWLGEAQERTRRFSFGTRDGRPLLVEYAALECLDYRQAVTSSLRAVPVALLKGGKVKRTYSPDGKRHGPDRGRRASLGEMCRYQGLPEDFFGEDCPFTETAKRQMIGNGVPLPMGRAIAKAVRRALASQSGEAAAAPRGASERTNRSRGVAVRDGSGADARKVFTYEGRVYVRPCGRGLVLVDYQNLGIADAPHLDDVLDDGDYWMVIRAERRTTRTPDDRRDG